MLQRNNIGKMAGSQFYPLPTLTDPLGDLDTALYSLAQKLRLHYSSICTPKKLIQNMSISSNHIIELLMREHHRDRTVVTKPILQVTSGLQLTSLSASSQTTSSSEGTNLLPVNMDMPVNISKHKIDILTDTYGMSSTMALSLSQCTNDKEALKSMERLVYSLMNNSTTEASEILRNHLLLDSAFKLRIWKPVDDTYYSACDPNGICGY